MRPHQAYSQALPRRVKMLCTRITKDEHFQEFRPGPARPLVEPSMRCSVKVSRTRLGGETQRSGHKNLLVKIYFSDSADKFPRYKPHLLSSPSPKSQSNSLSNFWSFSCLNSNNEKFKSNQGQGMGQSYNGCGSWWAMQCQASIHTKQIWSLIAKSS